MILHRARWPQVTRSDAMLSNIVQKRFNWVLRFERPVVRLARTLFGSCFAHDARMSSLTFQRLVNLLGITHILGALIACVVGYLIVEIL